MPPRGEKVELTCLRCCKPFQAKPSEVHKRQHCSKWCADAEKRKLSAWNPLQRRCLDYLAKTGKDFSDLAREIEGNPHTLRRWFRTPGSATSSQNIERLGTLLGLSPEAALAEGGGVTSEDKWSAHGQRRARIMSPELRQKMARAGGLSRRGKPQPPSQVANREAARKASGAYDRAIIHLRTINTSPTGRTMHSLWGRLNFTPDPTRDQLRQWVDETSQRLNMPQPAIWKVWRPYLRTRKLLHAGGPKANERRHTLINQILEAIGTTPSGWRPWGTWEEVARLVSEAENYVVPHSSQSIQN